MVRCYCLCLGKNSYGYLDSAKAFMKDTFLSSRQILLIKAQELGSILLEFFYLIILNGLCVDSFLDILEACTYKGLLSL